MVVPTVDEGFMQRSCAMTAMTVLLFKKGRVEYHGGCTVDGDVKTLLVL